MGSDAGRSPVTRCRLDHPQTSAILKPEVAMPNLKPHVASDRPLTLLKASGFLGFADFSSQYMQIYAEDLKCSMVVKAFLDHYLLFKICSIFVSFVQSISFTSHRPRRCFLKYKKV